jgi:hypothetical protein
MNCLFRILKATHWAMSHLCPKETQKRNQISTNNLPWFWIGSNVNGLTISITSLVNNSLTESTVVTPLFLSEISGYPITMVWKYVDKVTLEEKEIPSDGFVIANYV